MSVLYDTVYTLSRPRYYVSLHPRSEHHDNIPIPHDVRPSASVHMLMLTFLFIHTLTSTHVRIYVTIGTFRGGDNLGALSL